jgi:hypothetical protein
VKFDPQRENGGEDQEPDHRPPPFGTKPTWLRSMAFTARRRHPTERSPLTDGPYRSAKRWFGASSPPGPQPDRARPAASSSASGDRVRERAYIVGNYPPPPDSLASSTGFVRGEEGVFRTLDTVETHTATNLTYIGEWHTHPAGYDSGPSSDDGILLRWIHDVLLFSDVPPLTLWCMDTPRSGARCTLRSHDIGLRRRRAKKVP